MKTTLSRGGTQALRALGIWATFTVIFAGTGYLITDRGQPFLGLLKGAAINGVVMLIFYGLLVGYLGRRRQSTVTPKQDSDK